MVFILKLKSWFDSTWRPPGLLVGLYGPPYSNTFYVYIKLIGGSVSVCVCHYYHVHNNFLFLFSFRYSSIMLCLSWAFDFDSSTIRILNEIGESIIFIFEMQTYLRGMRGFIYSVCETVRAFAYIKLFFITKLQLLLRFIELIDHQNHLS